MGPAKILSAVALSTLLFTSTQASITVEITQPSVLPGYTAYGIYWDGGGTVDWTSAEIIAELTQGTFYEDAFGGYGAPNSAFFGIVPTLEFDTYFGIIDDGSTGIPCATECFPPLTIESNYIYMTWFNTDTSNTGYVKIGNFTVTDDAIGTWRIASAGVIYEGIIPEPATLALFGLAVPALLRRR